MLYLQRTRTLSPRPQEADLPQKMKGKELHAHVRGLLARMDEDDREEFFANAEKQGF